SDESITKKKFNIKNGSFNFENAHVEIQKEKKIVPPVLKQTNETT
ncbi:MAG: hypothetical protein QG617_379, partial [Campylobacterota bacterium]|nr:hypothetical protein [Campylobacterota bacterium]